MEADSPYPIHATYLDFYRNLTPELWRLEFSDMKALAINTVVIISVGHLQPSSGQPLTCALGTAGSYQDSSAYSLAPKGFLYPSSYLQPKPRPATDLLELVLQVADENGMNVYIGSLQTATDWTDGSEFCALRTYNAELATEMQQQYGHHRSFKGWYFNQEIWMNWVKAFGTQTGNAANYYGTALLADWVATMKGVDPTKMTTAAVVVKESPLGAMPGLTPDELQQWTASFLSASKLDIFMPQDGAGAQTGAPAVGDLAAYYNAMSAAIASSGSGTSLWSTLELFTVPQANVTNGEQYPPTNDITRIQSQVNNVQPYVSGYVSWNFGDHLSPQATYYPVEASELNRKYTALYNAQAASHGDVIPLQSYWYPGQTPATNHPDNPAKPLLSDRTGGGYGDPSLATWVGFSDPNYGNTTVQIVGDLGNSRSIQAVRALVQSATASGIFHPSQVTVEVSSDSTTWLPFGSTGNFPSDTSTFAVMWAEVDGTATARYVRWTFTYQEWLFLAELEVTGN